MFKFIYEKQIKNAAKAVLIEPSVEKGKPSGVLIFSSDNVQNIRKIMKNQDLVNLFISEVEKRIIIRDIGNKDLMARADMSDYYKNMKNLSGIPRYFLDKNNNEIFRWE